jgi:fumarate reductase flavoprotein subunit
MMGGVHTDINGATPLPGLYAAGEVACVSINGANRLGSNSLPELLVFGARAGRAAAEYASTQDDPKAVLLAQAKDEQRRLETEFLQKTGRERLATIRDEMQTAMEQSAGIYRTGDSLAAGAERLHALQERVANIAVEDHSRTFNTERIAALELSFMLDVAEAIVNAALRRRESRGAHQRTDFPARDDQRFLAHSLTYRTVDGSSRVEYLPVKITRWPPGERVYGEVATDGRPHHAAGGALPSREGV